MWVNKNYKPILSKNKSGNRYFCEKICNFIAPIIKVIDYYQYFYVPMGRLGGLGRRRWLESPAGAGKNRGIDALLTRIRLVVSL
jgi:hypothetical protein